MTPESQIAALAELDGWTNIRNNDRHVDVFGSAFLVGENDSLTRRIRPYLTSYDAILPLVKKQSAGVKYDMAQRLRFNFSTTPEQIAEALLRATGRWTG